MYLNYVATDQTAPAAAEQNPLFSEAGVANLGFFTGSKCHSHSFAGSYTSKPTVLLAVESAANSDDPLDAYLTEVSTRSFTVCTHASGSGETNAKVHWIALGDDVPQVTPKATTYL